MSSGQQGRASVGVVASVGIPCLESVLSTTMKIRRRSVVGRSGALEAGTACFVAWWKTRMNP